jgi:hypothetical protein
MTDAEWAEFMARLAASFEGEVAHDREHELRRYVGRVPFELACRALEHLITGGQIGPGHTPPPPRVFTPTPSELVAALRHVTGGGWPLRVALSGLTSDELAAQLNGERGLTALPGGPS